MVRFGVTQARPVHSMTIFSFYRRPNAINRLFNCTNASQDRDGSQVVNLFIIALMAAISNVVLRREASIHERHLPLRVVNVVIYE